MDTKTFNCNLCDKKYGTASHLSRHKKTCGKKEIKPTKTYLCTKCNNGNDYKTTQHLNRHMEKCGIVKEKKKYLCTKCNNGNDYKSKQHLNKHMEKCGIVKEKKKYYCDICEGNEHDYGSKALLDRHKKSHAIKYKCLICGCKVTNLIEHETEKQKFGTSVDKERKLEFKKKGIIYNRHNYLLEKMKQRNAEGIRLHSDISDYTKWYVPYQRKYNKSGEYWENSSNSSNSSTSSDSKIKHFDICPAALYKQLADQYKYQQDTDFHIPIECLSNINVGPDFLEIDAKMDDIEIKLILDGEVININDKDNEVIESFFWGNDRFCTEDNSDESSTSSIEDKSSKASTSSSQTEVTGCSESDIDSSDSESDFEMNEWV